MTKKEQIYEIAKYVCNACEFGIYRACSKRQTDIKSCSLALGTARRIYNAGYRKVPDGAVVLTPEERDDEMKATNEILAERDDLIAKVGVLGRENYDLKAENEQLKAKLEKNPMAIKQKIMEEDDYELTEREQATLFLDRMESDVEILNDIVENLDELLGKGIDEYIKGIDGVEGLNDMWERSAVKEFAGKLKEKYSLYDDRHILYRIIDELLKEYE